VLAPVDISGLGLEIGPSHNPLLPKSSGARIEIVDHASRQELIAKYRELSVPAKQLDQIEEVDYISSGGSLVEAVGRTAAYDYIICSNVVEHMVDLIGFLQDCDALLKPNGRLSMTVPDHRLCFDLLRPVSSIGEVVDTHLNPTRFHTPGGLLEFSTYFCRRGGQIAWSIGDVGPVQLNWDGPVAKSLIEEWSDQTEYIDAHRWTFTPSSFSLLVQDLRDLGYHSLAEFDSEPALGHEFFVTLGHCDPPPPHRDRLELMQQIRRESALVAVMDGLGPPEIAVDLAAGAASRETDAAALASSHREIQALQALVEQREEALASARRDLDEVLLSRSWQATRPLRRIASLLRRH
jgi:SAM-dependent methyltransferase